MLKIVLAGSVKSSLVTLQALLKHEMNVVGVLGYEPENPTKSGSFVSMKNICNEHNIPYYPFKKINSDENIQILKKLNPDIFFVVGLSQLVSKEMLEIANLGNVGFHPTHLPRGRGRAPIAWLVLEEKMGAANFFLMGENADDGPIFIQETFTVEQTDNAASIQNKIFAAIKKSLDKWLPSLKNGKWIFVNQNESFATYYGKRNPEDGIINWSNSAEDIDKLIRASSMPHPGAYSFAGINKIIIWSSRIENSIQIKGVTGRILIAKPHEFLVQCANGLIWISDVTDENMNPLLLKVGQKLGFYAELEIYNLKKEIQILKDWIQKKMF